MKLPDSDYQILRLTEAFYHAYPNPPYVEILKKNKRAYNCILFQTHYGYLICIPYRSEITHSYAYHFKKSARSKQHKSGLDYTKIVIISNMEYIDDKNAFIDKDEFNETMMNLKRIKKEALTYVEDYVAIAEGRKSLHLAEYKRKYGFSPLKYFHRELGIKAENSAPATTSC